MEKDPKNRLSAKEALAHPWMNSRGKEIILNIGERLYSLRHKGIERMLS